MERTSLLGRWRREAGLLTVAVSLALLLGCQTKESGQDSAARTATDAPGATASAAAPSPVVASDAAAYPATDEGAKALLAEFVKPGADHATLSQRLRPDKADLEAIFEPDLAAKAEAVYGPAWDGGQLVVAPKPGQTEVKISSATSDEIKSGSPAAADFAGGWRKVADKLKPGIRIYRFSFVEPGKDDGMAFDGLTHVNGHWRIVPKPWRVL